MKTIFVQANIEAETEKAIKISQEGNLNGETWIPKSQIEDIRNMVAVEINGEPYLTREDQIERLEEDAEVEEMQDFKIDHVEIEMAAWLGKKKNLLYKDESPLTLEALKLI